MKRPFLAALLFAPLIALPAADAVRKRDRRTVKSAEAAVGATALSTDVAAKLTGQDRKDDDVGLIKAVVSEDRGRTFKLRGQLEASHDFHAIEPMAVERQDGSLWMLIRAGTYPDARQTADGTIFAVWDYQRSRDQEILLATFREQDVLAGFPAASAQVNANRRLVSKGGVK